MFQYANLYKIIEFAPHTLRKGKKERSCPITNGTLRKKMDMEQLPVPITLLPRQPEVSNARRKGIVPSEGTHVSSEETINPSEGIIVSSEGAYISGALVLFFRKEKTKFRKHNRICFRKYKVEKVDVPTVHSGEGHRTSGYKR